MVIELIYILISGPQSPEGTVAALILSQNPAENGVIALSYDFDLSTYGLIESQGAWLKVEFPEIYYVEKIVLYLIFYTEWFYFPDDPCLLSLGHYKVNPHLSPTLCVITPKIIPCRGIFGSL